MSTAADYMSALPDDPSAFTALGIPCSAPPWRMLLQHCLRPSMKVGHMDKYTVYMPNGGTRARSCAVTTTMTTPTHDHGRQLGKHTSAPALRGRPDSRRRRDKIVNLR